MVNSIKDTLLISSNGSIIEIPKDAFLNSNGEIVTENIELKFRTFLNPLDTYLAGIPMTYSIDGEEKTFESAGMFEIKADSNGEELFVNDQNKIKVALISFNESNVYNTYDLEADTGTWNEIGKDSISVISKEDDLKKLIELPIPPRRAGKFAFEIQDEISKNSEISNYKNVWFTPIDGVPCGFDAKDVKLRYLVDGAYEVTFVPWAEIEGLKTKCICYLSFKDDKVYNDAMESYQKKYAQLIIRQRKIKQEIDNEWLDYRNKLKEYNIFYAREEIEKLKGTKKILRTLEVNNFGFVNIDKPLDFPQGANITPLFVNSDGESMLLDEVVLVEKDKNALYRYKKEIKFNPDKENLLWGLTKDGKLAYFKSEDFKELKNTSGETVLKMTIHPKPLNSYDDIYGVLFLN
jgi:hypothetical protein